MNPLRSAGKRDAKSYDPRQPHPFIPASDVGTAGMAVGSMNVRSAGAMPTAAADLTRSSHCAVPGCGKGAADEVHAPADK